MSAARRKWEQDLIATAALMGAVFEEVIVTNKIKIRPDGIIETYPIMGWTVNLFGETTSSARAEFREQWFAAYWYLVERYRLSFQNNQELIPCARYGGMLHTAGNIHRHQSYTKEAAWRREQKNISK